MANDKVTLIICDGMGLSPELRGNAIFAAPTPTLDYLFYNYPSMRLLAAGTEVGLDTGEPGNSEVGHGTIGTGQILPQAFQVVNAAIKSGAYKTNKAFLSALEHLRQSPDKTLHLVGLVSKGGVHGHLDHMLALLTWAKDQGIKRVAVHAITDGRDSPPRVALEDAKELTKLLASYPNAKVASIGGRFYAMDRDNHWDRTDAYYWSLLGKSFITANSLEAAVTQGYNKGQTDENLDPTIIIDQLGQPILPVSEGDVVLFTNYRPDRVRQLATRIIMTQVALTIITMTDYFLGALPPLGAQGSVIMHAFPLPKPQGTLAQVLSANHKTQLHIAETEKYAHITYFFNGHEETKRPQEEWLLIPSPSVDSFDRVPEMSARAITRAYISARQISIPDFTTVNFANMDMVGHTGNLDATKQAVQIVDEEIGKIVQTLESSGEWLLITADHGNAEQLIHPLTGEIDKEHTTNPVPFILVHPSLKKERKTDKQQLATQSAIGILADIAPTVLEIMALKKPGEMVGNSLLAQLKRD